MKLEAGCRVRRATARDAGSLVAMMRELALFEGYAGEFRVSAADLLARGLAPRPMPQQSPPEFIAFVAEPARAAFLCGYAVVLVTPFTHDLRPTVTLKELFVDVQHRKRGVADALLAVVKAQAVALGAGRIRWQVLPGNEPAQRLYRRWGGGPDTAWDSWEMRLPPMPVCR